MLNNRLNISGWLIASLVALGVGGLIVLINIFGVAAALLGPGTGDIEPDAKLAQYVRENEQQMDTYEHRFDGRSVFYIPPVRPPKIVAPPVRQQEDQGPVTPPPPPPPRDPVYDGPSLAWAITGEVWFRESRPGEPMTRLRLGEEANGITLVSTDLPRSVTVRQHGKEFVLPVLKSIDWVNNPDKSLNDESMARHGKTPKGMKIVDDAGKTTTGGFTSGQPATTSANLNGPVQPQGTAADSTTDEEVFGPPIPDELADVVLVEEPVPIPQVEINTSNDETAPSVPISTHNAAPPPSPSTDPDAEQAGGAEAGETPGSGDQSGNADPDNPGPPPE